MIDSCFDDFDLDRKCFNFSSALDGFSSTIKAWGSRLIDLNQWDNAANKAKEIGIRIFLALGAILSFCFAGTYLFLAAVASSIGSKIFRKVGFYFQKDGFTHVRGRADEISLPEAQATVMTWNFGGYGRSWMDRMVDQIRSEQPHVIVLQGVQNTALIEALIARLEGDYAHFYTHCGESGCMVITRCAVHSFSHTAFSQDGAKGFAALEIKASPEDKLPCVRIMGTELTADEKAQEKRIAQVTQIVDTLAKQKLAMPTLLVGSFPMGRNSKEDVFLSNYVYHSATNPSSDRISFFKRNPSDGKVLPVIEKNIRLLDSHLVKGFSEGRDSTTGLSPRPGIVTTFSGLRAAAIVQ